MVGGVDMPRNWAVWQKVRTDFKGRPIEGDCRVDQELVFVRYEGYEKSTQKGNSRPTVIAQRLLRELANEAEKDQAIRLN
jgi:hypothetical protein